MNGPVAPSSTDDPERWAALMEATGNYRVLRRMPPLSFPKPPLRPTKRAIFVDVETTGLDAAKDRIIELAVPPFDYTVDGTIVGVGESLGSFQDPGFPIPLEITALTGIDNEMVRGKHIDPHEVAKFVDEAALVISHNAGSERPFCEREWSIFAAKPWACSLQEIDWISEGFAGRKLSLITAGYGLFFNAHRAVDDCRAGVDILARLPRRGRTGLSALLASARTPRWRLWVEGAPYAAREALKARKYRWSSGDGGRRRAWYREVEDTSFEGELDICAAKSSTGKTRMCPIDASPPSTATLPADDSSRAHDRFDHVCDFPLTSYPAKTLLATLVFRKRAIGKQLSFRHYPRMITHIEECR